MRILTLCLIGTLGLTAACGGGGAYERSAASPAMAMRTQADRERAKKGEADNDADGIPDKADAIPKPEAITPGQIACLSGGGVGCLAAGADAPPPRPPLPGQPPSGGGSGSAAAGQGTQSTQREGTYLIYTATLTMAVYQVEGALGQVEQIGRDVGGYLAVRQDRSITIRVPRARFEEALKKIEQTGDVVHREITAEDVTDEFLDTEVRLKNARAMRDRLQELLAKAAVKEALEIEKELGRVTQEIERMEGRLKLLRDKIAFSTITVNFDARASSLKTMPVRLPFTWLPTLGLPTLLRLNETK